MACSRGFHRLQNESVDSHKSLLQLLLFEFIQPYVLDHTVNVNHNSALWAHARMLLLKMSGPVGREYLFQPKGHTDTASLERVLANISDRNQPVHQ